MTLASRSASFLALRQLGCAQAVASSSRRVAHAFSTSSSSYAAPTLEEATARKGPFSTASEASPAPTERNAIGRGRKSAGRGRPNMLAPFDEWIQSDARAYKQPKPGMGPNWIGDTPFPLNPSFNPPPPVRQSTKTEIWRLHTSDPAQWTIRALSEKFSIGLQRMEAILRLKALEAEWTLQVRYTPPLLALAFQVLERGKVMSQEIIRLVLKTSTWLPNLYNPYYTDPILVELPVPRRDPSMNMRSQEHPLLTSCCFCLPFSDAR